MKGQEYCDCRFMVVGFEVAVELNLKGQEFCDCRFMVVGFEVAEKLNLDGYEFCFRNPGYDSGWCFYFHRPPTT